MAPGEKSSTSQRIQAALQPPIKYLPHVLEGLKDKYHPVTNPQGVHDLAVAQNALNDGMLQEYLSAPTPLPASTFHYDNFQGTAAFRSALASHFLPRVSTTFPWSPENICIATGAGGIINLCAFCLCDAGESMIIPTPCYGALPTDLGVQFNVSPAFARTHSPEYRLTAECLDMALAEATANGHPPRALLLTNPQNPIGICYSEQELRMAVEWCRTHEIHLLSDEVYALSVYEESVERRFVSVADLCGNSLGEYVHIVHAFSKDFGMSGFRVGTLYTENPTILKAWGTLGYFSSVSNYVQVALTRLLNNSEFLDEFFRTSMAKLRANAAVTVAALKELGIPFVRPTAGLFVWVDMRALLPANATFEDEFALFEDIYKECKVILSLGESCRADAPGYYRICFGAAEPDGLNDAFARLRTYISKQQRIE